MQVPALKNYVGYLLESCNNTMVVRSTGTLGRGVQVLDSGNCDHSKGKCGRSCWHRDFDNGRLTSVTTLLAMDRDCIGFPKFDEDPEPLIVHLQAGDVVMFPTTVFHFGCSHKDFCGSDEAVWRRRLFVYLDHPPSVDDENGSVQLPPIPHDYDVQLYDQIPSIRVGFMILQSRLLAGRIMQTITSAPKKSSSKDTNLSKPSSRRPRKKVEKAQK